MIRTFRHKGLEEFFLSGSRRGIRPDHASRLRLILGRLDGATTPRDMNLSGMRFHGLKGEYDDYFAVSVSGNWRVVFRFDGENAVDVDYVDYH